MGQQQQEQRLWFNVIISLQATDCTMTWSKLFYRNKYLIQDSRMFVLNVEQKFHHQLFMSLFFFVGPRHLKRTKNIVMKIV